MLRKVVLFLGLLIFGLTAAGDSYGAKKSENLKNARQAVEVGNWELADFYANSAIEEDPESDAAWSLLGQVQMTLGDTAASFVSYRKALEFNPKQPQAVLTLVYYLLQSGDTTSAERIVSNAEKSDVKSKIDEIKVARGLMFASRGDFPQATRLLVSAAEKNRDNPLYPQFLARLYNGAGIKEQAEIYYKQAWELNPTSLDLAYEYALVLQDLTRYNEALELFRTVQAKDPDNKSVDYMIGRLYYASRKWNEAAQNLQQATEKNPNHFLSYFLLGKSILEVSKMEKKNFYQQAEASLRRAAELTSNKKNVHLVLAEVLFIEARLYYQRAMIDTVGNAKSLCDSTLLLCREVMTLDSTTAGVYSQMARAWSKIGDIDSTIYYGKLQLGQTPDDATEFARLVSAMQKKKDYAGLGEVLTPAFDKLDWSQPKPAGDSSNLPQDVFIAKYAGVYIYTLFELKQVDFARAQLARIHTYKPDWADGYNLSAYVELNRQNWAGAIPILTAGVKACPTNAELWVSLGDSQYFSNPTSKDNVKRAKESYLKASQLGNKDAAEKYKLLNK